MPPLVLFLPWGSGDDGDEKAGLTVSQKGVWLKGTQYHGLLKSSYVAPGTLHSSGDIPLSFLCLPPDSPPSRPQACFRGLQCPHAAETMLL